MTLLLWRRVSSAMRVCLAALALSLVPLAFPAVDEAISAVFWNEAEGRFLSAPWRAAAEGLHRLSYVTAGLSAFALALTAALRLYDRTLPPLQRRFGGLRLRAVIAAAMIWAVGPGLIVNGAFKGLWGRARPLQTERFGGDKRFSPPWIISDQCASNCSFSSGDPSVGCALAAMGLVDRRRRRFWFVASLAAGSVFGGARIALGKHYAGDVAATFFVCYGVYAAGLRYVERIERTPANASL